MTEGNDELLQVIGDRIGSILESTIGYIGVTFSPLDRFHTIRDREVGSSHFPSRWRAMDVIAHGSKDVILALETALICK